MVYKSGQIFLPFCHNAHVWRTDKRTDGWTEFSSLDRICIACSVVKSWKIRNSATKLISNITCCTDSVSQIYAWSLIAGQLMCEVRNNQREI